MLDFKCLSQICPQDLSGALTAVGFSATLNKLNDLPVKPQETELGLLSCFNTG